MTNRLTILASGNEEDLMTMRFSQSDKRNFIAFAGCFRLSLKKYHQQRIVNQL
jgi:hypothetical protein